MDQTAKEKLLAGLRQQQCKEPIERVAVQVLKQLAESEVEFDLVGTVRDEVGNMFMYVLNKKALLSEFCGGVFSYLIINRIEREDFALGLYMAHERKRAGKFLQEELEMGFERIINSLHVGEHEGFGQNAHDG